MHQLPIPDSAAADQDARQVLSIWSTNEGTQVALDPWIYDDPGCWGLLLADLVKHVARAYEASTGADSIRVVARVRELFDAEWEHPTDTPTGGLE
ncbi:MAG: DUF5076 domain-containing protein [Planctomyces sp.]|nr:DUF5076 domain-containing protein [Planctomyces sp.]